MKQYQHTILRFRVEIALMTLAALLAGVVTWQVYELGLMRVLVDQNAHLNLARQAVDSLTPGLSQIGFWPPLLHVLLIPAVSFDQLYRSGLAAVLTLAPVLALAAVLLYKTLLLLTKNRAVSVSGALVFLLNPYVLYYTATPMMEVLYIANLFGVAYFFVRWIMFDRMRDVLFAGLFVTLSTLSRFEGIILIPIAALIVLVRLWMRRSSYYRIEAYMIAFSFVASLGLLAILAYGYILVDNPLAFMNSEWSAFAQQRDYVLPTARDAWETLHYLRHAAYHIFSLPLAWAAIFGFPLLILLRPRFAVAAASLILFSPYIFDALALYRGNAIVYVPELHPFSGFFNERYGMYWIGFAILVPALLIGIVWERWRSIAPVRTALSLVLVASVALSAGWLYRVAFYEGYRPLHLSLRYAVDDQREIARTLRARYDFGNILMTRALHDIVALEAGIPLASYIQESNAGFYDVALERPWLFARWVVMQNTAAPQTLSWVVQNEKVALHWARSREFARHYTLIRENSTERLYKVNEEAVRLYAAQQGYSIFALPSLNPALASWSPETIYARMSVPLIVTADLARFYVSDLRPHYEQGLYADEFGNGNSESQSYALLQSFAMGDRETFERVWQWTRAHLQRSDSRLFSWKFSYNSADQTMTILDANSATDADTDIAYALLRAGTVWNRPDYISAAREIIPDIWDFEVTRVGGRMMVAGGNWASGTDDVAINPSYFAPHAYRLFALYDPLHDWNGLARDGYAVLEAIEDYRASVTDASLPPNWVAINRHTGAIRPFNGKTDSLDYSYDAFRVFWRVAQDALYTRDGAALAYLSRTRPFSSQWQNERRVCTIHLASLTEQECQTTTSTLAGALSILSATSPATAEALVEHYYRNGRRQLVTGDATPFYEKSWYWFALQLWSAYTQDKTAVRLAAMPAPEESGASAMALRYTRAFSNARALLGTLSTSLQTTGRFIQQAISRTP